MADPGFFFVGRSKFIQELSDDFKTVHDVRLSAVEGLHGAGKTRLIEQLDDFAKGTDFSGAQPVVLRIPMTTFDPNCTGLTDNEEDLAQVLGVNYRQLVRFLRDIAARTDKILPADSNELFRNDFNTASETPHPSVAGNVLDEQRRNLERYFVAFWNHWVRRRKVLLALDDADVIIGQPIGKWLFELAQKLENTMVVMARFPSPAPLRWTGVVKRYPLGNFTADEVTEYLRKYLRHRLGPDTEVADEVCQVVHQATGGYPALVGLAGDLIGDANTANDADGVARQLAALPTDKSMIVADLVHTIVNGQTDQPLREALKVASVARQFDDGLLATLLLQRRQPTDTELATTHMIALERYSFVSKVQPHEGDPAMEDEEENVYLRMHELIRNVLDADLLREIGPTAYAALHAVAAENYYQRLVDEDGTWSYGSWYAYEKPEWQRAKREWVYHTARQPARRKVARLQFAHLFLDAFWWWGLYMPFDFCEEIVSDMPRKTEDDRVVIDAVRTILCEYPVGYKKPSGPHWQKVRVALKYLEGVLDLHGDQIPESPDARHVKALIEVFLAHSWRYDDITASEADDAYTAAVKLFSEDEDHWNLGWMAYERADLAMARGSADASLDQCAVAAKEAYVVKPGDERDEELTANIHRVVADCHWLQGEAESAFDRYSRAIIHAYLFHRTGERPDTYTRLFHIEMVERCMERLQDLWSRDPGRAESVVARIDQALAPYRRDDRPPDVVPEELLQREQWPELTACLTPRPPSDRELYRKLSDFMSNFHRIESTLRPDVHHDLQDIIERGALVDGGRLPDNGP
jgi:hypothetical protein